MGQKLSSPRGVYVMKAFMLSTQELSHGFGARQLFDGITFSVESKERVALVGENGAGKSTLLQILSGQLGPELGAVHRLRGARLEILAQEPRLDPEASVVEVVQSGLAELFGWLKEHQALCEGEGGPQSETRIAELTALIDARGGFDVEHRVERVLSRLSIRARQEPVRNLSGGERRRVDLARVLIGQPEIMLLDEPTNHLDRGAIDFLRQTLIESGAAILFTSHDRAFIDDTATRILELDGGDVFTHRVPYSNFLENRLTRREIQARTLHNKERMVARELAWLRAGTPARTTKQNARKGRAEALIDEVTQEMHAKRARIAELEKTRAKRLAKTILELKELRVARGDKVLIEDLNLILVEGERWGILGENGAGKTSLLRTILGDIEPQNGQVIVGPHTRFAVFDQHRSALSGTVEQILCPDGGDYVHVGEKRFHIASWLERFLFAPEDRKRDTQTLSGGEQNRLLLSRLFSLGANFLILDEPTNDLDIETLGVLEDALLEHEGVALIVSHDRRFLDRVATGILAFESGQVVPYQGDYTHYERIREEQAAAPSADLPPPASPQETKPAKAQKAARPKTKRSYNEEREYQQMEERVLEAEMARDELLAELDDGKLYGTDAARAAEVSDALANAERSIETLYARWQELEAIGGVAEPS